VLRNASVTGQLGAKWLTGLVGNIAIPRQTAQTSTYWVGESSAITESEGTFDQVTLSPKTLGALSKISRLMLLQSTPAIEQIVRADLVRVIALGIDLAAIAGSGSAGQPKGIINQTGINTVAMGTNGGAVTVDAMIQLQNAMMVANAPMENLGFAINAKTFNALATLKASTGQYLLTPGGSALDAPVQTLLGRKMGVSNQLRSNLTKGTSSGICSEALFGNWQELLIGNWGSLELLVNPYDATGFTTGDVLIRAMQTVDVGVRHAPSWSYVADLTTSPY
jgi:HK97 family phage major capsid protein